MIKVTVITDAIAPNSVPARSRLHDANKATWIKKGILVARVISLVRLITRECLKAARKAVKAFEADMMKAATVML